MTEAPVEVMARAMCLHYYDGEKPERDMEIYLEGSGWAGAIDLRQFAKAALSALEQAGYVIVKEARAHQDEIQRGDP